MKRALYEWSWMLSALFALVGLAYWGSSLLTDSVDFRMRVELHRPLADIHAADGGVTISDYLDTPRVLEMVDRGVPFFPAVVSTTDWGLLGVRFRRANFTTGDSVWSLSISSLAACAFFVAVSAICFRGYRRVLRLRKNRLKENIGLSP